MLLKRMKQPALLKVRLYAVVNFIRPVDTDFSKDTAPCWILLHLLLLKILLPAVDMDIIIPAVAIDTAPC